MIWIQCTIVCTVVAYMTHYQTKTAGGNGSDTIYLGTLNSANDCFATAEAAGGKYHSVTWHTPGFSGSANPFDGQCFGVTGMCLSVRLAFFLRKHTSEESKLPPIHHGMLKDDPLRAWICITPLLRK